MRYMHYLQVLRPTVSGYSVDDDSTAQSTLATLKGWPSGVAVPTAAELDKALRADEVRAQRNALLDTVDKAINHAVDNGLDATALRAKRQALRDVPAQVGFPDVISWPV